MEQGGSEDHEVPAGEGLRLSDFSPSIGAPFPVDWAGGCHSLTLLAAEELAGSPRAAGGFRLEFTGPSDAVLPQGIYAFSVSGERQDIFLVPLGPRANVGLCYEAVFF